jgi:hypothetical protein
VVGSVWEEQAKKEGIRNLGQRIRQSLLAICLPRLERKTNDTEETADASPSTNRGASLAQNDTWPPPPPTSEAGSLGVVAPGGGAAGSREANYPAGQRQNIQGISPDRVGIRRKIYLTSLAGGVSLETFIPPLFYAIGDHIPKVILLSGFYIFLL